MAWTSREDLERFFTYQAPTAEDVAAFREIRTRAKHLATAILDLTPASADQSAAIRLVREAVMTANAAIACRRRPAAAGKDSVPEVFVETVGTEAAMTVLDVWACPGCGKPHQESRYRSQPAPSLLQCRWCTAWLRPAGVNQSDQTTDRQRGQ